MISTGVLAQAIETAYQTQAHLIILPGTTVRVPITPGVTQVRLQGIAPGGPGGGGKTAGGGGGGGSAGEYVGSASLGKLYNLPATTKAIDFYNGLLGTPGRANAPSSTDGVNAQNSTAYAVLANNTTVLLQSLRGGARGFSAVGVNGGNGASSPNGEMVGGAGSNAVGTRGGTGNFPGDIASYITAGNVVPGASGGGGGFYESTRSNSTAGTGGFGGAADSINGNAGVNNQGVNGGADAGAGGNNPGFSWTQGYNGKADSYSAGATDSIINTAYGSGGSGGVSGSPGRKGGLGCWRMLEIAGTNPPGAWRGAERLYNGPRVFPATFIRPVEPGWPGPAGGYGTQYSAPAYAGSIGGLRAFGWEDGVGTLANGTHVGAAGPAQSIISDPANPTWTWYDARIAAAAALGLKITISFFGTPRVKSTNPSITDEFTGVPWANLADLSAFVTTFLTRYGYGTIDRVECWNEPAGGNFFTGSMAQLVDIHHTIKTAAKAVDSRFVIVSAGWIGSGDALKGVRTFLNASGAVNTSVKGYQTFDSWGAHPYDCSPNEMSANTSNVGDALFSSNKGCIAEAMEEVISLGGTWGGFDVTECGFTNPMYALADDGQRGLFLASHLLNAFCLGANTFSPFQIKSGLNTDNSGRKWFGPTSEALCASVFAWFKRYIVGYSIASIKEQINGTSQSWRITRGDGATFYIDAATFLVAAPPAPPPSVSADYTARSTAAGVVWSHDISAKEEITSFLTGSSAGVLEAGTALHPSKVTVPVLGTAMRFYALGAKITSDLLVSGGVGPRPVTINDATYWPDPAATNPMTGAPYGSYYVHTTAEFADQQNNLWLVTAKSGNTLTVTYQAQSGQPLYGAQKDWVAANTVYIGHQCGVNWSRLFSALKADSTGRVVDDINKPGKILRSVNDQTNFPHGGQAFGYAWYGHADEQAAHPTWRPSDYGPVNIDSVLRSNVWDGDEFWLQWRQYVDPRMLALNVPNYNNDNRWGRKTFMLQSQMTVPQQLAMGYGPGGTRYQIPSTPEPVVAIAAYSVNGGLAGRLIEGTNHSLQPGGPYDLTAINGTADAPVGSAYENPSGQWVTFLLHVKAGHNWDPTGNPTATGVQDTTVELYAAKFKETVYTKVISKTNEAIIFGSSGPTENTWTTALPGWNAVSLTGYLNMELGAIPPAASYYMDFGQIIFAAGNSAVMPACPNDWPFTLPAAGTIGQLGSSVPNDTAANGSGFTAGDVQFNLPKVLGAWGSAQLVRIYDANGALSDLLYVVYGGGHGDTGYDGVIAWRASTNAWELMLAPSRVDPVATADTVHGEDIANRPASQHMYFNLLALDSNEASSPCIVQAYGSAVGSGAISAAQAHAFNLVSKTWSRFGDSGTITPSSIVQCFVKDTKRKLFIRFPSDNGTNYFTFDYTNSANTWQSGTMAARVGNWGSVDQVSGLYPHSNEAGGVYDPVFDAILAGVQWGSAYAGSNLCICDANNIPAGFSVINFTGTGPVTMGGFGIEHRNGQGRSANKTDTFIILDTSTTPPTGYFELSRPAGATTFADLVSGTWTWARHALTGTSNYTNYAAGEMNFGRPKYVAEFDAWLVQPSADHPMEFWKL